MGTGRSGLSGGGKFTSFGKYWDALKKSTQFYSDHSNSDTWSSSLSKGEYTAIYDYTGEGGYDYHKLNKALYNLDYKDMDPAIQKRVDDMVSGLSKFKLLKGIQVTRQCGFAIFGGNKTLEGIREYIQQNGDKGVLTNKGALSFGSNDHGAAIDDSGLVIHAKVPPSVGSGAYVNPISKLSGPGENEWLFTPYSKFKFDLNSLRVEGGKVHINCMWVGRERHK